MFYKVSKHPFLYFLKLIIICLVIGNVFANEDEGPSGPPPAPPGHAPAPARMIPGPDEYGDYHLDDMRLNENQFKQLFGTEEEKAMARQATAKKSLLWDKVVPYTFAANVNAANRALVKDSLKSLNAGLANCLEIRYNILQMYLH